MLPCEEYSSRISFEVGTNLVRAKFARSKSEVRSKLERNFTYFGKGLHEVRSEVPRTSVEVCTKFVRSSKEVRSKFFCEVRFETVTYFPCLPYVRTCVSMYVCKYTCNTCVHMKAPICIECALNPLLVSLCLEGWVFHSVMDYEYVLMCLAAVTWNFAHGVVYS